MLSSTHRGYRMVNFDKNLTIGFREMEVFNLGGGAIMWCGTTGSWWLSAFSTQRTMNNVVGMKSISTSGPELWGFEFWGLGPKYEKCGTRWRTKTCHSIRCRVVNKMLKFGAKNLQILGKSALQFCSLKLQSLYSLWKIFVIWVWCCISGNQWYHAIKKGRSKRMPSTLATSNPCSFE